MKWSIQIIVFASLFAMGCGNNSSPITNIDENYYNLELSHQEQAAVASAILLMDGYAGSNQWMLINVNTSTSGVERVSMRKKTAKNLPGVLATNTPPDLYATVQFTDWNAEVQYYGKESGGDPAMQDAIQKGITYLAQLGGMPAGFWITCDKEDNGLRLFIWTEPNRWPGDHCSMFITDDSVEYFGGE